MNVIDIGAEIEAFKLDLANDARYAREEEEVIDRFQPIFCPENLDGLRAEDFRAFLRYRDNKHWWGIQRQGSRLTRDMAHLRRALHILLDEARPIQGRLDQLFPKHGPKHIKFLGRAVATPILLVAYPDKYSVYNRKVKVMLEHCGLHPEGRGLTFAQMYVKVNNLLGELARRHEISRFLLDWVSHRVTLQVEKDKRDPSHWTSEMRPEVGLE